MTADKPKSRAFKTLCQDKLEAHHNNMVFDYCVTHAMRE